MPDGARPKKLTRAARREQLLDAALELIAERGIGAISMEGVAAQAGVSKALPYTHFEDATALLTALRNREIALFDRRVTDAFALDAPLEEKAAAAVHGCFELVRERRGTLLAVFFSVPLGARIEEDLVLHLPGIIEDAAGVHGAAAETARWVVAMGLSGALIAWARRVGPRELIETVYTRMIIGGLASLAEASTGGTLPPG